MRAARRRRRYSAMESRGDSRSSEEDGGPAAAGRGRPAGPRRATGRLVESTQAEDRRLIALVGARPLLYARSTLPVASYYSQVKRLWQEVADIMGWTVAEVRRKWSHIRNSYSRHLRNEIHGLRTGRGRMVSRWYLADDLEFLRHHMATDTRPSSTSSSYSMVMSPFAPALLQMEVSSVEDEPAGGGPAGAGGPAGGGPAGAWYAAPEGPPRDAAPGFEPDETADYFHFFRGLYGDYQELTLHAQRTFRRECVMLLHKLVEEEGRGAGGAGGEAADEPSDADDDRKCFAHELVVVNGAPDDDDDDERAQPAAAAAAADR